jgi:hypothetical protein
MSHPMADIISRTPRSILPHPAPPLVVLAGENLYLAPDWKPVKVRTIKGSVDEAGFMATNGA